MRALTLLGLALSILAAPAVLAAPAADPPRGPVVALADIRQLPVLSNCGKDLRHYLTCAAVANALVAALYPSASLVPLQESTTRSNLYQVYSSVGQLPRIASMAQLRESCRPAGADTSRSRGLHRVTTERARRERIRSAWIELFHARDTALQASLPDLFKAVEDQRFFPAAEERVALAALNEFQAAYLDPLTQWIPATSYNSLEPSAFPLGFGLLLESGSTCDGLQITVRDVVPESPAARVGVWAGDEITRINGKAVASLTASEADHEFEQPRLRIAVRRNDRTLLHRLDRGSYPRPNVRAETRKHAGRLIGYLSIRSFQPESTCRDVERELVTLAVQDLALLILDLRENGGGMFANAACVASHFLEKGAPVARLKRQLGPGSPGHADSVPGTIHAQAGYPSYRGPLAVLVGPSTTSGGELVAGALQANRRSVTLGMRTYGKGTAQRPFGPSDGRAAQFLEDIVPPSLVAKLQEQGYWLLATFEEYTVGNGVNLDLAGVLPEIPVMAAPEGGQLPEGFWRERDLYLYSARRATRDPPPQVPIDSLRPCFKDRFDAAMARFAALQPRSQFAADFPRLLAEDLAVCRIPTRF
jgi:C-terminal peptidase prc